MILGNIDTTRIRFVDFKKKIIVGNRIIVPNVGAIAREMTSKTQISMIIGRFLSLSLTSMIKFIVNNMSYLPQLAKMDYAVGVKVLCELEILRAIESNPKLKSFILHNQMVDMAIALKNVRVIRYFFDISKKYNFDPMLLSYNPTSLIEFLSVFGKLPDNLSILTTIDKNISSHQYIEMTNIKFYKING